MQSDRRKELMELVYAGKLTAEQATARYREHLAAQTPPVRPQDVAIVGMSGRFPAADNVEEYWSLLRANRSAIVDVSQRWPEIDDHYSADLTDLSRSHSRWGALMNQILDFDPLFFELSPRQAQLMEPRQRLLLMESWRALEDAGYSRAELDGQSCGVFVGCEGSSEYFDQMKPERMDGNAVLGHSNAVMSARLAYFMNLRGPAMTVDTACSSSLVAIHLACQAIRDGSADLALAGGVTVMLSMGQQLLQSKMGMLSPQGRCKTFDADADGFVPGESAAVVVLKSLSSAIRDRNHIYGVVKGSAINQDGKTNGITAPSAHSQRELIERATAMSEVDPATIRYVEAHGTGTRLGDPIEVEALARTYGAAGAPNRVPGTNDTGIGSVKTNIGHTSAASGVASVIKVLLGMREDLIPASINCDHINPRIDLTGSGLYIVRDNEPMFRDEQTEAVASVSSFGYSGTNAHLVISSARHFNQVSARQHPSAGGPHHFFASAASRASLRALLGAYAEWLRPRAAEIDPAQLGLQTLALRTPMRYRVVIEFDTIAELTEKLTTIGDDAIVAAAKQRNADTVGDLDRQIDQYLAAPHDDAAGLSVLLGRIAPGYLAGADAAYHRLAGLVDRRLHLPTYRFESAPYGLDAEDLDEEPAPAAAPGPDEHQGFVMRPSGQGDDLVCELTGSEQFLRDHSQILPMVGYLELFRGAAAAHAPGRTVSSLTNVICPRLMQLPLGVPATILIRIEHRSEDRIELAIHLVGASGTDEAPYASAQITYGTPATPPTVVPEDEFRRGLEGGREVPTGYRRLLADHGVGVGPVFRGGQQVFNDDRRALVELGLETPIPQIEGFLIHPSFVDAGFSGIAAWISRNPADAGLYVPFTLGRMTWYDLSQPLHTVRIVRTHEPIAGDVRTAGYELTYLSRSGEVVIHLENLFMRRADGSTGLAPTIPAEVVALTETWQPGEDQAPADPAGLLIALARSGDELRQFRAGLSSLSAPSLIAAHGVPGEQLRPGEYRLTSLDEAGFGELVQTQIPPNTAIRFLLLGSADQADPQAQVDGGVLTVLRLTRTLLRKPVNSPVEIVFCSSGRDRELAISGFFRTLNVEKPQYRGRVIDIAAADDLTAVLRREATTTTTGFDVRYRGPERSELRLDRCPDGVLTPDHDRAYPDGSSFLITGGAGGIGLALARHLFDNGAARVYLCGRSELDDRRRSAVADLQDAGHDVRYISCDVTDPESVRALVGQVRQSDNGLAPAGLTGIFHAAGVLRDRFVIAKDEDSFREVIAPKTTGTDHIVAAAEELGCDFVAFFSSTSAVLGNPGQCDYSFGNRYLDVLAGRSEPGERQLRLFSFNWSVWADGGMQIPAEQLDVLETRFGLTPLPFGPAFAAMDACLARDQRRAVLLHGHVEQILANFFAADDSSDSARAAAEPTNTARGAGEPTSSDRMAVEPARSVRASAEIEENLEPAVEEDLREVICATLRLDAESIDFEDDLARYGFDSISFSELANRLNEKFDLDLTPAIFFGYTYLHELKQGLLDEYGDRLAKHYAARSVDRETVPQPSPAAGDEPVTEQAAEPDQPAETAAQLAAAPGEPASPGDPASPVVTTATGYQPVAIIGMSTRLPQSADSNEFWEHLVAGDDLVTEIPADRWDWRAIYGDTATSREKTQIHHGAFMERIDLFDPYFFGIAGTDAEVMDPQERLMLEEAWHALEDAGYDPTTLAGGDTGIFVGVSTGDYKELLIKQSYPNMLTNTMIPNRISFTLNLHGPSMVVDTACSSALVAIHEAVEAIQLGRCGLALAGAVNVICAPGMYITQGRMKMLSPGGSCKTFDAAADGYVRGEGCGMVVLKSLAAAERDGDRVLGVIRGSATNHGGTASNLFAPNEAAQAAVIQAAYRVGAVPASQVSYIETHGTGTPLGDPIEVNALKRAYRELYQDESLDFNADGPRIRLGAVKTNTGHLEAASALPGLLKILYSFQTGVIPGNIHFSQRNPYLQIDQTPLELATQTGDWDTLTSPRGEQAPRLAALSSFGIGGVNAHMVLQAPDRVEPSACATQVERRHLLPISARTREQLRNYVQTIREFVASAGIGAAHSPGELTARQGEFLARCADALGFASVSELDLSIPLEDYEADPEALVVLLADLPDPAGLQRLSLAEIAKLHDQDTAATLPDQEFLAALCHVFQTGRTRFKQRAAFVFGDARELLDQLDAWQSDQVAAGSVVPVNDQPDPDEHHRLARNWLAGEEVDFAPITTPTPKISAPGYPFDRQRFWYTDYVLDGLDSPGAGGAATPVPTTPAVRPPAIPATPIATGSAQLSEPRSGSPAPGPDTGPSRSVGPEPVAAPVPAPDDQAALTQTITTELSTLLKVPLEQIASDADFASFGLDSIRLIQFSSDLNEAFGTQIDPSFILDHPTVAALAGALAGQVEVATPAETAAGPAPSPLETSPATGPAPAASTDQPNRLKLNYGVQLDMAPVILVSATDRFDREKVTSFWRDLKKGIHPDLELRSVASNVVGSIGTGVAKYCHLLVRTAAGQYAETYVAGSGKPLLMIMGIGMAPSFAALQIEAMAGKRKIICISMPGVGLSPVIEDLSLPSLARYVLGTLDQLGIDRFDILGVSWGSLLAATLAAQGPERVTNLVLISPNSDMGMVADPTHYITGIEGAMARDFSVVAGGEQADQFFTDAQCLETRAFLQWSRYFGEDTPAHHETGSILPQIGQRSLVIIGARDTIIDPREAEVVALYLRNSERFVIPDASHLPLITHPELVNALVDGFLDGKPISEIAVPATGAAALEMEL